MLSTCLRVTHGTIQAAFQARRPAVLIKSHSRIQYVLSTVIIYDYYDYDYRLPPGQKKKKGKKNTKQDMMCLAIVLHALEMLFV